jgi:23S rRNA pseudouridine1911/1915/1917 synthase
MLSTAAGTASKPLDVLYCDNHIIVVNKPAGILSQGDRTADTSILDDIKAYIKEKYQKPGDVYIGLVHRLDRPCSGVMVFARNSKAAARLSEDFRTRAMDKKYVCVVNGDLQGTATLNHHVYRAHSGNKNQVAELNDTKNMKHASLSTLSYTSILSFSPPVAKVKEQSSKSIDNRRQTLLQISLITGRKHQIRCQLSYIGHPIVGDGKYGAMQIFTTRDISLHSYSLTIRHPVTQQMVRLTYTVSALLYPTLTRFH